MGNIEKIIKNTNSSNQDEVNWTKVWSEKYPILEKYQNEVNKNKYRKEIRKLLDDLKDAYGYSELDATLVLKDILYHEYKK